MSDRIFEALIVAWFAIFIVVPLGALTLLAIVCGASGSPTCAWEDRE